MRCKKQSIIWYFWCENFPSWSDTMNTCLQYCICEASNMRSNQKLNRKHHKQIYSRAHISILHISNTTLPYIRNKHKLEKIRAPPCALFTTAKTWKQPKSPLIHKQNVRHTHIKLFSHKKGGNFAIYNNMDGARVYYVKWNKSDEKDKCCMISLICGI